MATTRVERAYAGAFVQFMSFCAAAASVAKAFSRLGTLEADFSAAAAFVGDLVFVPFFSVLEDTSDVVLDEPNSSAAAAFDGDIALGDRHPVFETVDPDDAQQRAAASSQVPPWRFHPIFSKATDLDTDTMRF